MSGAGFAFTQVSGSSGGAAAASTVQGVNGGTPLSASMITVDYNDGSQRQAFSHMTGTTTSVTGILNVAPIARFMSTKPAALDGQFMIGQMTSRGAILMANDELPQAQDDTNQVFFTHNRPIASTTSALSADDTGGARSSAVTKATAGRLYGFVATNLNSSASRQLQFYNSATVPADAAVPKITYTIGPLTSSAVEFRHGIYFSTGIAWACSTTIITKTTASQEMVAAIYYA